MPDETVPTGLPVVALPLLPRRIGPMSLPKASRTEIGPPLADPPLPPVTAAIPSSRGSVVELLEAKRMGIVSLSKTTLVVPGVFPRVVTAVPTASPVASTALSKLSTLASSVVIKESTFVSTPETGEVLVSTTGSLDELLELVEVVVSWPVRGRSSPSPDASKAVICVFVLLTVVEFKLALIVSNHQLVIF